MFRKVPASIASHYDRKWLLGLPSDRSRTNACWHVLFFLVRHEYEPIRVIMTYSIFGPDSDGDVCTADPVWQSPAEVQPEAEPYAPRVPHDRAVIAALVRYQRERRHRSEQQQPHR